VNMKILNTAFEAEGLPKVDDPEVMENILNGLDFDPTPRRQHRLSWLGPCSPSSRRASMTA
jgi:hypothetical protein